MEFYRRYREALECPKLRFPGYRYRPQEAARLEIGDERCWCGAREFNLRKRRERVRRAEIRRGLGLGCMSPALGEEEIRGARPFESFGRL